MSYWSHNPELLDEIVVEELLQRANDAPGECIINFQEAIFNGELDYYQLEEKFGADFSYSVTIEAERNYWDGFRD